MSILNLWYLLHWWYLHFVWVIISGQFRGKHFIVLTFTGNSIRTGWWIKEQKNAHVRHWCHDSCGMTYSCGVSPISAPAREKSSQFWILSENGQCFCFCHEGNKCLIMLKYNIWKLKNRNFLLYLTEHVFEINCSLKCYCVFCFSVFIVMVYFISLLEMLLCNLFQGLKCCCVFCFRALNVLVYFVSVLEQWWRANPNWCVISVQSVFEQNEGDCFGF